MWARKCVCVLEVNGTVSLCVPETSLPFKWKRLVASAGFEAIISGKTRLWCWEYTVAAACFNEESGGRWDDGGFGSRWGGRGGEKTEDI